MHESAIFHGHPSPHKPKTETNVKHRQKVEIMIEIVTEWGTAEKHKFGEWHVWDKPVKWHFQNTSGKAIRLHYPTLISYKPPVRVPVHASWETRQVDMMVGFQIITACKTSFLMTHKALHKRTSSLKLCIVIPLFYPNATLERYEHVIKCVVRHHISAIPSLTVNIGRTEMSLLTN